MSADVPSNCHPQPLMGQRVMVTRPETAGTDPLGEQLRSLGATVLAQPAIRLKPPDDWQPVDRALSRFDQFDWLVFSSANGVRFLLERLQNLENGTVPFVSHFSKQQPKLAAIGPGTAEELVRYGLQADLVPEEFHAESLAEALVRDAVGRRFLLARASRGRDVLAEQLTAAGAVVEQVVVYNSIDVERPAPEIAAMLAAGQIDWITVTSSAIARSLARLFGTDLRRAKLASISPLSSDALRRLGYEPAAEATESTMSSLVAAIVRSR